MTDNVIKTVFNNVLTPVSRSLTRGIAPEIVFQKLLSSNLTDGFGPPVLFTGTENYNANGILIDGTTYLRVPSAGLVNNAEGFMFLQWTPNFNGVDIVADHGILRSGNSARFFYLYLSTRTVVALDGTYLLALTGEAFESAEQFRQTVQIQDNAGIEQAGEDLYGLVLEAIARQAHGDQGVVVRPDRPVVIGHGIVPRCIVGECAYPPTAE